MTDFKTGHPTADLAAQLVKNQAAPTQKIRYVIERDNRSFAEVGPFKYDLYRGPDHELEFIGAYLTEKGAEKAAFKNADRLRRGEATRVATLLL